MKSRLLPQLDQRTLVMGILNLTEDSFSGDGLLNDSYPVETALSQAAEFLRDGADILDLGAESTRPGATPVEARQEIARLVPVIEQILEAFPETVISVDTYKSQVAEACLKAGAKIVNDVWGFKRDLEMPRVVVDYEATVVLMHNHIASTKTQVTGLGGRYVEGVFADIVREVCLSLSESVEIARLAGVADEQIILDPGIGFGKSTQHNLQLLQKLDEVAALGFPVLLGASRKSMIGYTLNLPVNERLEGSLAAAAWGILHGADILRVHDVKATVRLARMLEAIQNA